MKKSSLLLAAVCTSALTALLVATGGQAALIVTAVESGGDVVLSTEAGGSVDLTGLTFDGTFNTVASVNPGFNLFVIGGSSSSQGADYYSAVGFPTGLGSGAATSPDTLSGDRLGFATSFGGSIVLPDGYVSGSTLSTTATFAGETFSSLGLNTGSFVWTLPNDTVTLNVQTTVPVPAAMWLFGSGLLGLIGISRRK